jgi:hypothetical protein
MLHRTNVPRKCASDRETEEARRSAGDRMVCDAITQQANLAIAIGSRSRST